MGELIACCIMFILDLIGPVAAEEQRRSIDMNRDDAQPPIVHDPNRIAATYALLDRRKAEQSERG